MTIKHKGVLSAVPAPPTEAGVYHLFADETADDYFFQTQDDIFSLTGRWSSDNTFERTGFVDREDSTIVFSDTAPDRTMTITPVGGSFTYLIKDRLYSVTSADSIQIPDVEGRHFIYYDGDTLAQIANPTAAQIEEIVKGAYAWVCAVRWDATNNQHIYFGDERHGAQMDGATHWWLHRYFGTQLNSGCALNTLSVDDVLPDNASAQFGVDAGVVEDEDIAHILDAVGSTVGLPVVYLLGVTPDWRRSFTAGYSILTTGTGRAAWNENVGGTWQLTEVDNNDFVLVHVWATNDAEQPYLVIVGQAEYDTRNAARDGALTEISTLILAGLPFVEFKPIATLIVQTSDGYANPVKSRFRSVEGGGDYIDWRFSGIGPAQASPADHNSLSGKDGGVGDEFYHHTLKQWTINNRFSHETGVLSGGNFAVNGGDSAKIDIDAGTGQIVDRTDPTAPVVTEVSWDALLAVTLTNLATDELTGLFMDSTGSLVQRTTTSVSAIDFRQMIFLGIAFHTNNTSVTSVLPEPSLAYGAGEDFRGFMAQQGHVNLNGNVYSDNGANLYIDRTAGQIWATGSNFHASPNLPSLKGTASATQEVFDIAYDDGSGGIDIETSQTISIDPDVYNPNGAGTTVPVNTNRWTIQRIFMWANGETVVMLGEQEYVRAEDALAGMETEADAEPFLIAHFATLRAYLIVKKGATDLSDPAQAIFEEARNSAGGGGGGDTGENNVLVNVGTVGIGIVEGKDGVELQTRSIQAKSGSPITVAYNAGNKSVEIDSSGGGSSGLPTSYIQGLNTLWVSVTTVQIAAGSCRSDDDSTDLILPSTRNAVITTVGAGGRDGGSEASDTSYHIWLIYHPVSDLYAALISTSSSSPTMPSGYTKKRRVGSFYNDTSSDVAVFRVNEHYGFRWVVYDEYWPVLTGGSSTSWPTVNCSPECPSTARMAWMNCIVDGGFGTTGARFNEYGASQAFPIVLTGEGTATHMSLLPIDSSQRLIYRVENGSFDELDINVMGYLEKV